MKLDIRFGCVPLVIDTGTYIENHSTGASEQDKEKAEKLLAEMFSDEMFASSGRRNNDAVNACICLHVLGFDAVDFMDKLLHDAWPDKDYMVDYMMEHVNRVYEYLDYWGPSWRNQEAKAFDYMV
jgi:hypothetical protein